VEKADPPSNYKGLNAQSQLTYNHNLLERPQGETAAHLLNSIWLVTLVHKEIPKILTRRLVPAAWARSDYQNIPFGGCLMASTCPADVLCNPTGH
jgi:hypothetical protein